MDLNYARGNVPNQRTGQNKWSRFFGYTIIWLACAILMLLLVEGLARYALVTRQLLSHKIGWVGQYARFDSELGWATIPNVYFENLFGPGVYFRSNSQGFRNAEDFSKEIPTGKFRIICSGDSFTMGSGVSNDQTWCQALTRMDHRIQTVNMGQGAYGIDQAYLWYERDGSKLDLDLHIMAFIYDDFARMTFTSHWGYGKPILVVENERLAARNVPVPRYNRLVPALADRLSTLNELGTVQLLTRMFNLIVPPASEQDYWKRQSDALPLAFKVFQSLREMHTQKNRLFVTVYLPTESDCLGQGRDDDKLRQALDAESRKVGLWFWDLTGDCQQLPGKTVESMFFGPKQIVQGHLTGEGNRLVASLLYRRMMQTPEIAARLESAAPAAESNIHPAISTNVIAKRPAAADRARD